MYPQIPSSIIRRGLIGGFKCPISGQEFVSDDGRQDTKKQLYQEQQDYTAALMHELDGGVYQSRDLASYQAQYADYVAKKQAAEAAAKPQKAVITKSEFLEAEYANHLAKRKAEAVTKRQIANTAKSAYLEATREVTVAAEQEKPEKLAAQAVARSAWLEAEAQVAELE
jgi:hypothetical protein